MKPKAHIDIAYDPGCRQVPAARTRPPVPRDLPFHRNPALEIHRLDTGLLLTDPTSGRSRRLDALAAFVWYLLKDPTTANEAVITLQQTCPDRSAADIRSDVETLFRDLLALNMILPTFRKTA